MSGANLNDLLEEIKNLRSDINKLRETIDSRDKLIENMSAFLSKNGFDIDKVEEVQEVQDSIENIVNSEVDKINSDEPKDIMVVNNTPKVDDSIIYGTDEENYNNKIKNTFADNFLSKQEEKAEEKKPEEKKEDNYILGTNIPKPRNRGIFETDEEYENYLKDYYSKYFPESKELATINADEPKGLAVLEDVAKNDAIKKIEDALNNKYEDIYSDSNKVPQSEETDEEIVKPKEVKIKMGTDEGKVKAKPKTVKIKFDSDEDKKNFEKNVAIDYTKDKNKKTTKIKKIRKGLKKFKEILKKHGKKIIAGILVATAAIGAAMSIKGCSYDDSAAKNFVDNTKSNSVSFDSTIPSEKKADEISNGEVRGKDIVDKVSGENNGENKDPMVENPENQRPSSPEKEKPANSNDQYDLSEFNIGEPAQFTGDSLYYTADDAAKNNNALKPDLPKESKRTISLINFVSPDGLSTATAHTPEEADKLRASGWIEKAYNFTNDDYNVDYEGWVNKDALKKVK